MGISRSTTLECLTGLQSSSPVEHERLITNGIRDIEVSRHRIGVRERAGRPKGMAIGAGLGCPVRVYPARRDARIAVMALMVSERAPSLLRSSCELMGRNASAFHESTIPRSVCLCCLRSTESDRYTAVSDTLNQLERLSVEQFRVFWVSRATAS